MVIIGILTTIGVVSFSRVESNSRNMLRSSKVTVIASALEKYYNANGEYPTCAALKSSTVTTDTLKNVNPSVLTAPTAASGNNSIMCTDSTADVFTYIVNGSQWTLKYHEDGTGNIISVDSRHGSVIYILATVAGSGGSVSTGGSYSEGSTPTITAVPSIHHAFSGWSGSVGCSGSVNHTVTMYDNKTCTANFYNLVYVVDSYSETNWNTSDNHLLKLTTTSLGQSFSSDGGSVVMSKFLLHKWASPTGSIFSKIYNATGTFGSNSLPTGSPIATSNAVDASVLTNTRQLISFNFTGNNIVKLTNGAKYVVSVEYYNGTDSNYIYVGEDSTSPTHAGNFSWTNNSTWFTSTSFPVDFIFYVYNG